MRPLLPGLLSVALGGLLLAGCTSVPGDALRLNPQTAEQRRLQTRRFDGTSEAAMLAAGLGLLQDLGFTLDSSESKLGVISASRKLTGRRSVNEKEALRGLFWTAVIPWVAGPFVAYEMINGIKEPQVVRVSLVTCPAEGGATTLRITAQRLVYQDERHTQLLKAEPLNDPEFYREFFARLTKSVFLEEQKT